MTGSKAHRGFDHDNRRRACRGRGNVPRWGDHELANSDGMQSCLRADSPVFVIDVHNAPHDPACRELRSDGTPGFIAKFRGCEEHAPEALIVLLNGCWLKIVEAGQKELGKSEIRVVRELNFQCRPEACHPENIFHAIEQVLVLCHLLCPRLELVRGEGLGQLLEEGLLVLGQFFGTSTCRLT